ncbi:HhH-GPD-type base excision DNA repair protein [Thermocatellispora tengchongensis]|uniref:HhH-GPD-type base excision DNA repair protein n=1 Tax=Thermocatellispora tengchongensis TaxID=1073253 RepID=UPI00363322EE
MRLQLAQRADADELLGRDPFALLVGMLLDQQIPMEWAFAGPRTIADRLGGDLSPEVIAQYDPDDFAALLARKPAVHRYPSSMARRVQALAAYLVEQHDGSAEELWRDVRDGRELLGRLMDLPGFGRQKAQIFLALLGKQLGVRPPGWRRRPGRTARRGCSGRSPTWSMGTAWRKSG